MSAQGTGDSDEDPFEPVPSAEPTVLDVKKMGLKSDPPEAADSGDSTEALEPHSQAEPSSSTSQRHSERSASTPTGSGITGLSRASKTGITTAAPLILQAEEHARTVALLRLVLALSLVTLGVLRLPREGPPGRPLATAMVGFVVLVAAWLLFDFRTPERYDWRKALFFGECCVFGILSVCFYVGVFSPAIIAMYVGIYFFALGDSPLSGWAVFLSGALGYLVLCLLGMFGFIDVTNSVLALASAEKPGLIATTLVCQVLFATTFWMARRSRGATLAAFERLERAARQIKKRDALLDEARADLDRERAAKLGRFTDQQVGNYAVAEVIGRGAMGEVYRGFAEGSGQAVAVKFLNAALAGDPSSVERFFREVDVARRVKNRHIVSVLDHGMADGGSPFLVMELLEGSDLAHHLRDKKRLGMGATLELVSEVAEALAAADEGGIVHRDLKPQNLFLSEGGAQREWKVLDFGVSKILEGGRDLTLGAAVGTPSYMSPEQARGEAVDHRADVFALGVIAYRVLTGRPAFTGPDSASTLYNVVHVQPVRPSELIRVHPDVERVLALALAKQRDRRFSSSLMFAAAFREAARQRLDERLRRDADDLIADQPWGKDLLQVLRDEAKRWGSRRQKLSSLTGR